MVNQAAFCGGNSRKVVGTRRLAFSLAILALGTQSFVFAQTKPERQSKAAKPTQSSPSPTANPSSQKATAESDSGKPEDKLFKGMKYRMIGPFRGGRSLTAAGIPGDPTTYYFGATGGGVWKSTDGAMTWSPIFDKEGSGDIGSLAVSNSDHNTIYVGTGEACIRGNIAQGDGVYKSLDGGKTWKNIGLHDTRAIGKVIINPNNPDIVFVAALGHPYGPNTERGIFRTTDGGKTWEKVLYKDENTGGIDIAFDPHNPQYFIRRTLAGAPHFVEFIQRRTGQRDLPLERWRYHVEATGRAWSAERSVRTHRDRGRRELRSSVRVD